MTFVGTELEDTELKVIGNELELDLQEEKNPDITDDRPPHLESITKSCDKEFIVMILFI